MRLSHVSSSQPEHFRPAFARRLPLNPPNPYAPVCAAHTLLTQLHGIVQFVHQYLLTLQRHRSFCSPTTTAWSDCAALHTSAPSPPPTAMQAKSAGMSKTAIDTAVRGFQRVTRLAKKNGQPDPAVEDLLKVTKKVATSGLHSYFQTSDKNGGH